MFMKRDYRFGVPYYKYVGDTSSTDLSTIFSDGTSSRITAIFNNIKVVNKTYEEILDDDQNPTGQYQLVIDIVPIGISDANIIRDFVAKFENCQWVKPFYFESAEGNTAALAKLNNLVKLVLDENEYKYRTLADSLGFVYDPIASLIEKYGGKDELKKVFDDKFDMMEISGPVHVHYNSDNTVNYIEFDELRRLESSGVNGSTDRKGSTYNGGRSETSWQGNTQITTNTITVGAGVKPKTEQYTTSYDDSGTGRLAGYATDEGTIAHAGDFIEHNDMPVVGKIQQGKQLPDSTDTKTLGTTKEGRTVPAQDLIEAERKLARFSLLEEFFKDLKKKLLIAGWD